MLDVDYPQGMLKSVSGLMQNCGDASVLTMGFLQSCTEPLIYDS